MDTKSTKIICIILSILLVISIGIDYYKKQTENHILPIIHKKQNNNYVKNEIILVFNDIYLDIDEDSFIESLENYSYHDIIYDATYVIGFSKDFETRSELNNYCKELTDNNDFINYCEANNKIVLDDCNKGPC